MTEVKTCPFCGSDPMVETHYEYDRTWPEFNEYEVITVRCPCGVVKGIDEWNWREQNIDRN